MRKKISFHKIFTAFVFSFLFGLLFLVPNSFVFIESAHAAPCQSVSANNINWGTGRIASFNINVVNNNGCPNGWGITQGSVLLNDIPATITFWGQDSVSVSVPSSVEGLANIKVIGNDGITYGTNQLLISLKVNSYPSEITLGDSIEITGNFANTPGSEDINSNWPGRVVDLSTGGFSSPLRLISWTDTKIVISTSDSDYFKIGSNTFKVYYGSSNQSNGYQSKIFDINISAPPCTVASWSCDEWNACSANGTQARSCSKIDVCEGGVVQPEINQSCTYVPSCTSSDWSCDSWSACSSSSTQTRTCSKISNCQGGVSSPTISQSCTPPPVQKNPYICYPNCDARTCVNGFCNQFGYMKATVGDKISLIGFDLNLTKKITVANTQIDSWSVVKDTNLEFFLPDNIREGAAFVNLYGSEGGLIAGGTLTIYSKSTPPPAPQPTCSADTWQCGSWGTCSPQGIQTRSCSRTYDCPSAETAAPATSQYCEAPNKPKYQTPSANSSNVTNQDTIIKATAKLVCPVSTTMASQGSGTVINSTGLILTNKHVIDGTAGCWVGFIDNYDDEPYFGNRQIADIYKVSSDADAAVLKLRNPSNKTLTFVNISQSNSSSIKLGEILTTYGYPAKFGTKITYTSGDFSGVDGDYLKTTAIIEHGNSGGGAYLKNGAFVGIPTAVVKGSLNSMGYLLSVNKVNSWLNNSVAYNYNSNNNNYSRVSSMLEDMDLSAIGSLGLFIAGDEANIKTATESQKVIAEEKSLITKIDNSLSKRVNGKILLQVEKNGEGWYVYPDNKKKYYLGRPADAFSIMRNLGLGIKHSELENYLNSKFPSRLSGKIMLDVEQNGEAYYVNPDDLKGYYLNRPADAFRIMRELGLGITNSDIRKIDVGEVE